MEQSSSVDDLVGTFWAESAAQGQLGESKAGQGLINRSASEWSFQEFLKESLGTIAPAAHAEPGRPGACKSRFVADLEDVKEDPSTEVRDDEEDDGSEPYVSAPELQLRPNSGRSSSSNSAPSENLQFSPPAPGVTSENLNFPVLDNEHGALIGSSYSEDYERLLKQKLEMACAAVAMARVRLLINFSHQNLGLQRL